MEQKIKSEYFEKYEIPNLGTFQLLENVAGSYNLFMLHKDKNYATHMGCGIETLEDAREELKEGILMKAHQKGIDLDTNMENGLQQFLIQTPNNKSGEGDN